MNEFLRGSCRIVRCAAAAMGILAFYAYSLPGISSVTRNADTVGKYAKCELTVGLTATFTNPFDPDQVDLSATFTSPSSKTWKVNGFFDSLLQWRIRFAPNELGTYTYTVTVKDSTGTAQSTTGSFVCKASSYHGWIKVAPNNRYLCYDDGTSFYGVGCCYAWDVTDSGLAVMQSYKMNTWLFWNGTHKTVNGTEQYTGGYHLIETPIGKYDHGQCAFIDSQVTWGEARGLGLWLVIWPHDYLAQNMTGSWVNLWSANSYNTILSSAKVFYSDTNGWKYQQKMYRYIIARWGYSRALEGWQTIDEISGTDGWRADSAGAKAWVKKMAVFFHTNDPFNHPTQSSLGGYWPTGDTANTLSNTENYGSTTPAAWATIVNQLWNGWTKPAMTGESTTGNAHQNLWSCLAQGEAVTPLMWQFNQGWSTALSQNFPPLATFVSGINFAALTNVAQALVTVSGATAYGIKSDQTTFGWITGTFSGKSLSITGMANNTYSIQWFNSTASGGTVISTGSATATGGTLTATIPTTTVADIAFQITSPTTVTAFSPALRPQDRGILVFYRHGTLRFSEPPAGNCVITIINAQGRTVAQYKTTGSNAISMPVRPIQAGVYLVKIASANKTVAQRLSVTD